MLSSLRRAVFFGAHTDDEMVCAGTLNRLHQMGVEVHVHTFGAAATQDDRTGGLASCNVVEDEWNQALTLIGVKENHRKFYGRAFAPSSNLERFRQHICQIIFDTVESMKPDLTFILSPEDENPAHRLLGEECERVLRGRSPLVARCLMPWNYGIGRPNLYVELSQSNFDIKERVIDCYESQRFRYQYKQMLLGYAIADGLSVKVPSAEKFELIRAVL